MKRHIGFCGHDLVSQVGCLNRPVEGRKRESHCADRVGEFRVWVREKGGKYHVVPAHHVAIGYLDEYIEAAGLAGDKKRPLFRSSGQGRRRNVLLRSSMTRQTAIKMIKRRAREAGLPDEISNHSFRGTGITEYLRNGGDLENAARIAGHESTRTTQLYNRLHEKLSLDEIERIHI